MKLVKIFFLLSTLIVTGCKFNSSGFPVIPFMNNGQTQRYEKPKHYPKNTNSVVLQYSGFESIEK